MSKRSSSVTKTLDSDSGKISELENKNEDKKNKRKKIRKKGTIKTKTITEFPSIIKKKINPILINNLVENKIRVNLKKRIKPLLITFIFRRQKYEISIGRKANFKDLKEKISQLIEVPIDDINVSLVNYENIINDSDIINNIIKNIKFPIFKVKKKNLHLLLLSQIYIKNYKNKVIVEGIKNKEDFQNQIETFFNNNLLNKDFLMEPLSKDIYSISFTSRDIAFDFQRYLIILRLTNKLYYDIKSSFKNENPIIKKKKRNNSYEFRNNRPIDFFSSSPYINISTPYISYEEMRRKEEIENKKKWICDKNFFTAVKNQSDNYSNNYSKQYSFL